MTDLMVPTTTDTEAERRAVAAQLHELAAMIVEKRLPASCVNVYIYATNMDGLELVASAVAANVEHNSGRTYKVSWPTRDQPFDFPPVQVTWTAKRPELVGPREVDNGDQPAVIPDGVDGQPIGQHPARRSPRLP